jgi:hypothetical protein
LSFLGGILGGFLLANDVIGTSGRLEGIGLDSVGLDSVGLDSVELFLVIPK